MYMNMIRHNKQSKATQYHQLRRLTFPPFQRKSELPQVEFDPTSLYTNMYTNMYMNMYIRLFIEITNQVNQVSQVNQVNQVSQVNQVLNSRQMHRHVHVRITYVTSVKHVGMKEGGVRGKGQVTRYEAAVHHTLY